MTQKIIIPLIRKVYPNMIAQQITSVQPMSAPTGAIFKIKRSYSLRFRLKQYWAKLYRKYMPGTTIDIPWPPTLNSGLRVWLETNVGRQNIDWSMQVNSNDTERILVKFRWGKGKWATAAALRWA
jgi:hypothetical protein